MRIMQLLTKAILSIALLVPGIVNAAVIFPALDITFAEGDSGVILDGSPSTGFSFSIGATAYIIALDNIGSEIDIPNQAFTLDATLAPNSGMEFSGTFEVAGGLLMGTFDNLTLDILTTSINFNADLLYTGGSLMGSLTGGRLEGTGNATNLGAKLGEITVVPVPAAVWLFGSGLIGLVGVARRKV